MKTYTLNLNEVEAAGLRNLLCLYEVMVAQMRKTDAQMVQRFKESHPSPLYNGLMNQQAAALALLEKFDLQIAEQDNANP